jgi:hypothetical protein
MQEFQLPFTIKPVLTKNYYIRVITFIIIITIMVILGSLENGKINPIILICTAVIMYSSIYIIFRFSYRVIEVKEDQFIYKGLTRKIKVKYSDIENIFVLEKKVNKEITYSLIISKRGNWQISSIQTYRKIEMEMLIQKIALKNKVVSSNNEGLIEGFRIVKWIHD